MNTIKKLSLIMALLSTVLVQAGGYRSAGYYGPDGFSYTSEGYGQKKAYQQNLSERLVKA